MKDIISIIGLFCLITLLIFLVVFSFRTGLGLADWLYSLIFH